MTMLETKMEAVLRLLTAEEESEYREARQAVRDLRDSRDGGASEDAEALVRAMLLELGAPDHLLGHPYVIRAVLLAMEQWNYINQVTQALYPRLAQEFGTTASRVERAIRHLIEVAWDRGDLEVLGRYFGNTVSPEKGRPTNSEFIARMANMAKLRLKQ